MSCLVDRVQVHSFNSPHCHLIQFFSKHFAYAQSWCVKWREIEKKTRRLRSHSHAIKTPTDTCTVFSLLNVTFCRFPIVLMAALHEKCAHFSRDAKENVHGCQIMLIKKWLVFLVTIHMQAWPCHI